MKRGYPREHDAAAWETSWKEQGKQLLTDSPGVAQIDCVSYCIWGPQETPYPTSATLSAFPSEAPPHSQSHRVFQMPGAWGQRPWRASPGHLGDGGWEPGWGLGATRIQSTRMTESFYRCCSYWPTQVPRPGSSRIIWAEWIRTTWKHKEDTDRSKQKPLGETSGEALYKWTDLTSLSLCPLPCSFFETGTWTWWHEYQQPSCEHEEKAHTLWMVEQGFRMSSSPQWPTFLLGERNINIFLI